MPIQVGSGGSAANVAQRLVRLPGLPDFNAADWQFVITGLDGWDDGPGVEAVLVDNGGADGAVAVSPWMLSPRYVTVSGSIEVDTYDQLDGLRSLLLSAFPFRTGSAPLIVVRGSMARQADCRLYDRPAVEEHDRVLTFTLPLVAPDPHKYPLASLSGIAGGFVPPDWFDVYDVDGGDWYQVYEPDGSGHYRNYQVAETSGTPYPPVATLTSVGDATSRRVQIEVTGPLTAGQWWVENLATGSRVWADISLAAGQTIAFDTRTRTTTLGGANINHLVFGNYLTLVPGPNSFRLIAGGNITGSFMHIDAWEAHQ